MRWPDSRIFVKPRPAENRLASLTSSGLFQHWFSNDGSDDESYPPWKLRLCHLKRDRWKRKCHLPSINFSGDLWVFRGCSFSIHLDLGLFEKWVVPCPVMSWQSIFASNQVHRWEKFSDVYSWKRKRIEELNWYKIRNPLWTAIFPTTKQTQTKMAAWSKQRFLLALSVWDQCGVSLNGDSTSHSFKNSKCYCIGGVSMEVSN